MFICDKCGRQLEGERPSGGSLWLPNGGTFVFDVAPTLEGGGIGEGPEGIVLCDDCTQQPDSWPWWGDYVSEAEEITRLHVLYDEFFPACNNVPLRQWLGSERVYSAKFCPHSKCKISIEQRGWN